MGLNEWLGVGKLGYKFLSEFASLWELGKIERLAFLGYHLKNEIAAFNDKSHSKQERINAAFAALEAILKYKRANPQDFESIFAALERFCEKRKNDKSIDENLAAFIK